MRGSVGSRQIAVLRLIAQKPLSPHGIQRTMAPALPPMNRYGYVPFAESMRILRSLIRRGLIVRKRDRLHATAAGRALLAEVSSGSEGESHIAAMTVDSAMHGSGDV